jgi:FkbM family methyltransferase
MLISYARLLKAAKLVAAITFAKRYGIGGDSAPVYLDVGARGGLPPVWSIAARLGIIHPVFVEADATEAERLSNNYRTSTTIPYAVGSRNEFCNLYLTANRGRSSLLMPEPKILSGFNTTPWAVDKVERIKVVRLDQIWKEYSSKKPTYLKIDVQGYEKQVLLGMGSLIEEILCMQVEITLIPFYVEQPKFQEVFEFLYDNGFDLVKLKPHGLYSGAMIEFDAFVVRRESHNEREVKFWKKMNDVGSHKRIVTFGY